MCVCNVCTKLITSIECLAYFIFTKFDPKLLLTNIMYVGTYVHAIHVRTHVIFCNVNIW